MPDLPPQSEASFQRQVVQLARLRGWLCHAERPGRTTRGWRTPIQGDAGFPDLVLVRGRCVLFMELKSATGRLRPGQREWIDRLKAAGEDAHVFVPADWPEIEKILS